MGPDCKPVSRFRWAVGRANIHSVDARKEIAWFLEDDDRIESEGSRWMAVKQEVTPLLPDCPSLGDNQR
jgi:hypothetical protein